MIDIQYEDKLNILFTTFFIKIKLKFRNKIVKGYINNS